MDAMPAFGPEAGCVRVSAFCFLLSVRALQGHGLPLPLMVGGHGDPPPISPFPIPDFRFLILLSAFCFLTLR